MPLFINVIYIFCHSPDPSSSEMSEERGASTARRLHGLCEGSQRHAPVGPSQPHPPLRGGAVLPPHDGWYSPFSMA